MNESTTRSTQRIIRRETHSSRAVPSTVAALIVSVICLYIMLEAALKAVGQDAWLLSPEQAGQWIGSLPGNAEPALLGAFGLLIFLVGLAFFLSAILPGRRARHFIPNPRTAVVVDAQVLASSLARRARRAAGITPEQVLVTVDRRTVDVQVRPTSGIPVNSESIRLAVKDELQRSSVDPMPNVRIEIAPSGVIGQ